MAHYRLITPGVAELAAIYGWKAAEPRREWFTCRPVSPLPPLEAWSEKALERVNDPQRICRVLEDAESGELLGEINGFDFNERNHSMEFGYYMPEGNRGRGLGTLMIRMFLDEAFGDGRLRLNRIYATTSDGNSASKRALEKLGFRLDGRNRESYWIGGERYDQLCYSLLRREWNPGRAGT